jgi:hypothetical protein
MFGNIHRRTAAIRRRRHAGAAALHARLRQR